MPVDRQAAAGHTVGVLLKRRRTVLLMLIGTSSSSRTPAGEMQPGRMLVVAFSGGRVLETRRTLADGLVVIATGGALGVVVGVAVRVVGAGRRKQLLPYSRVRVLVSHFHHGALSHVQCTAHSLRAAAATCQFIQIHSNQSIQF